MRNINVQLIWFDYDKHEREIMELVTEKKS